MTTVTAKIVKRYTEYYVTLAKLKRIGKYEQAHEVLEVLDVLEEVLINYCGLGHDKMAEIRYLAAKEV